MAADIAPLPFARRTPLAVLALSVLLAACANTSDYAPPSSMRDWPVPPVDPAWRALAERGPAVAAPAAEPAQTADGAPAATPSPSVTQDHLGRIVTADPTQVYDLPALIDLAQRNNPATRLAWNQARQAANAIGMADATFLPMITAYVVGGYQTAHQRLPDVLDYRVRLDGSAHGVVPIVALEWLLFDFGSRAAARDAARNLTTGANFMFNAVHQTVIFEVMNAYYQYGTARARHEIAQETLRNSEAVATAVQAKRDAGLATSVEQAQAQQLVAQARLAVVASSGNIGNTRQALLSVLNLEPDAVLQVSNSADLPLPPAQALPDGAVLRRALANRPDIMASVASLQAAHNAVDGADAAFMPKVFLAAAYAHNRGNLELGSLASLPQHGSARGFLLGMSIPLYDGGLRSARLRQAEDGVQVAEAALEKLRQTAMREIATAANALETALQSHDAATALVQASEVTYHAALEAYRVGMGTVTVATEAANGLLVARRAQADAQAAAQIAAASLAFSLGQLNSADSATPTRVR